MRRSTEGASDGERPERLRTRRCAACGYHLLRLNEPLPVGSRDAYYCDHSRNAVFAISRTGTGRGSSAGCQASNGTGKGCHRARCHASGKDDTGPRDKISRCTTGHEVT